MSSIFRIVVGVLAACLLALAFVAFGRPGAVAAEPFCMAFMPDTVHDAQGYTFVGRLTSLARDHPGGARYLTFEVETVLADDGWRPKSGARMVLRAGSPLRLFDEGCDRPYGFTVGARYLYSTSSLLGQQAGFMVAWKLDGQTATLLEMYPQHGHGNAAFAAAHTLASAAALMVPGASLPPTSTASAGGYSSGYGDGGLPLWPQSLAVVAAGLTAVALRRRLRAGPRRDRRSATA